VVLSLSASDRRPLSHDRTSLARWVRQILLALAAAALPLAAQVQMRMENQGQGKAPQDRDGAKREHRHGSYLVYLPDAPLAPEPAQTPAFPADPDAGPANGQTPEAEDDSGARPVRELHPVPSGAAPVAGHRLPGHTRSTFRFAGQDLVRRTTVSGGVAATQVFRPWVRRGVTFEAFLPVQYYRPGLYAWARQPWTKPVRYRWGWAGQPWAAYYQGYAGPAPFYPGPLSWLVDYTVGTTLREAFQTGLETDPAGAPAASAGLAPVVRQALADELRLLVEQEGAEQQALAAGQFPPRPRPSLFGGRRPRVFLVPGSTRARSGGRDCALTEGDVLQLDRPPRGRSRHAEVVVLASRNPDLTRGTVVGVGLQDLQEMQNHMRAAVNQGLDQLQSRQGQDGLPALPAACLGRSSAPYAQAEAETP